MARPRVACLSLALLTATLPGGACGRRSQADSTLNLTLTLRPAEPVVGPAVLTVTLRDRAGAPLQGATVRLEGHMSHAGMAPVLADATQRAPGVYEVPFAFTMQGDWVLLVSAALPDGTRVERRIDVANVRP
jgi:hypothetical protein